ncbi:lysine-rich coiled-coil protein 1 [Calypte anna]|uniref:lysine-rich coiled-coil protein 1 n=1 Tax=Calypte anna TaxID=9244 RepID=UPI0011C4669F|nr:lysine-rich coiled-coil protein 1 [Calypte anna]
MDDILDEATRRDLFTDTFCKVCKAVLQFESQRMSHYQGKKHAQKVQHYIQTHGEKSERHGKQREMDCISSQTEIVDKNKYCNLCNKFFTSPIVALSHYLGRIHAKKLKQLSGEQANMLAQSQGMQPVPALQKPWAEKPLLPSKADEASSSSNTRLNLNDPEKFCGLCCAPFNNPFVAQEHYTGKKHRRNEARKKLVEELGDKAIPVESGTNGSFFAAIGAGYYLCPVCNIILASIETYQSHMQGFKHRKKEAVLARFRKEPKKTNYSFQGDITDYFSVQKARYLQPGGYLGKPEEKEFQDKSTEGGSDLGEVISSDFKCDQVQHYNLFSETQSPTNTGEKKSPSWPSAPENTPDCQYNTGCCKEEQASEVATIREKSFSLSVAQSECMVAETSTTFFRKEEKFQVNHSEDTKFTNKELKHEKETTKQKRKKNIEGADFGKESEKLKRVKVEIDLVNDKTSRPYRRSKENPAEKEMKQQKKGKKSQINVKREEELLWDESVLGYC